MGKVNRQTLNELGANITEHDKLYIDHRDGHYGFRARQELKKLVDKKWEDICKTADELETQCNQRLNWGEIIDIANIVFSVGRELPNREEVFCKILALLGVEVEE